MKIPTIGSSGRDLPKFDIIHLFFSELRIFKVNIRGGLKSEVIRFLKVINLEISWSELSFRSIFIGLVSCSRNIRLKS